jgi:hypothetical protein
VPASDVNWLADPRPRGTRVSDRTLNQSALEPAPVGARWSRAGTNRDAHWLSHPATTWRSRACPAIVGPGAPVGPGRRAAANPPGPSPAGLPPPPHPRPDRLRQARPGVGVRLRLPPHRRSHLLRHHAAAPPRRVDHPRVAEQLRLAVLAAYDRLFGLETEHLAVDRCITKAPCGGEVAGRSPVDRGKQGLKRSIVTESGGIPLGAVPAAANRRDDGLLAATLDTVATLGVLPAQPVVHLDAGYDYQTCRQVLVERAMVGQIATRGVPGTSPGGPPLAGRAHPRVGQPLRQAALVHRAPPAGGRVLVGAGQRRHRAWSIGASRLGLLPLGRPPTTTAITPTGAGSAMLRWTLARRGEVLSTRTGLTGQAKCCRYNL